MNIIDTSKFSWNEFEQNLFQDGKWEIPSKYKIKINDSSEKRYKLEMILYKMSHKYVARWALENAQAFLSFIEIGDKELKESIMCETTAVLNMRIDGKSSAYKLRNAGFLANKLGQMLINDYRLAVYHCIELFLNLLLRTRNFYYKLLTHLILRVQITRE